MRELLAICLLGTCLVLVGCGDDGTPPQSALSLSFSGDPPDEYDCNYQSRFEVTFTPYNDPGATGDDLWMFFRLQIDTVVFYESNAIQFPLSESGTGIPYTLEFGGAIEGENLRYGYYIIGYLCVIENDIITDYTYTGQSYISVTPKTYFPKVMHIEYDCQSSYNIGADTLIGGDSLDTFAKLAAAFHIADTDTAFLWNELSMRDSAISEEDLGLYHFAHWSSTAGYNMHLLGIRGLTSNPEHLGGKAVAGPFGWGFVFVQDIVDHHTVKPDFVVYLVTIHELGHQRGNLTHASGEENPHPENHDSPFCVMNQDLCYEGNNDNDPYNDPPGLKRWFDTNPHFCDMCVNTTKNVSW